MPRYQYTIKGTPYHPFHLQEEIERVTEELQLPLKAEVRSFKTRFVIEMEGEEEHLRTVEPELLRTMTQMVNIVFFNKKSYDEITKKYLDPRKNDRTGEENTLFKRGLQLLSKGDVIAVRGTNGYHLLANAAKTGAVKRLREVAQAPTHPLPVLFKNPIHLEKLVLVSKSEEALLKSEKKPFVIAKKRLLHRLERERYRYLLSPQINPLNQRVCVALAKPGTFYEQLFEKITFPLVSLDATTEAGDVIGDRVKLSKRYGDDLKYIFDTEAIVKAPHPRPVYQFIYGKACRLIPPSPVAYPDDAIRIHLDTQTTHIGDLQMAPLKVLRDERGEMQPALTAMSLLFQRLPLEEIRGLELPFSQSDLDRYCTQWKKEENIGYTETLLAYFDAIVGLCGEATLKSFETESMLRCEGAFEVCEEELFDYRIDEGKIEIDILSTFFHTQKFKTLASTLCNTISHIIDRSVSPTARKVALEGELFTCRDLTELTIEKLQQRQIEVHYC